MISLSLSLSLQSLSGSLCLSVRPSLTLSFFLAHSLSVSLWPPFLSFPSLSLSLSLKASIQSLQSHRRAAKMSNLGQPYESGVESRDKSDQRCHSELKEMYDPEHWAKAQWNARGTCCESQLTPQTCWARATSQGRSFGPSPLPSGAGLSSHPGHPVPSLVVRSL